MRVFTYQYFLFCFIAILNSGSLFAQKSLEIKKADRLYVNMEYASAIPLYEAVLERDSGNAFLKTKLADCYRRINDSRNAERLYSQLISSSTDNPEILLRYAEALSENGKYQESQRYYDSYSKKTGIDARARSHVKVLGSKHTLFRDSAWYSIDALSLNSSQADFSPMYYDKGLVFVSGRRQGVGVKKVFNWNQSAFLDLYYLPDTAVLKRSTYRSNTGTDNIPVVVYNQDHSDHRIQHTPFHDDETHHTSNDTRTAGYFNSNFSKAAGSKDTTFVRVGKPVNSAYHEGPVSFFGNGDSMIFTRSNFHNGKFKKSSDGTNKLKLYTVKKNAEGKWENVVEFPLSNDQYSIGHPALSPDKKTMYFVSDMPGGKGASDIWVTRFENNVWTTPENVTALNTEGNEMFPYVDENGNIYFSSDGHGGLGGLDIFYAIYNSSGEFRKLKNLGYPINSRKDDFGMIANSNQTSGYFSSNRKSGGYDDDIYSFRYLGPLGINLKGLVLNKISQQPLDSVRVVLYNNNNPVDSMITIGDGNFTSWKLIPDGNYHVKVFRNKYHPDSITFTTEDLGRGDTVAINIPMRKKDLILYAAGKVVSEENKAMANVKIKLYNKCTGLTEEVLASDSGNYRIPLQVDHCYLISAEKENCATTPVFLSTNNLQDDNILEQNFQLLCKGDIVKLDNIYYDLGKFDIREDAAKELDKLLPMMNKYPGMKFELRSHTDNRGSDNSNLALSDKRAKAAVKYLVSKGINGTRITGRGYGESLPIVRCDPGVVCSEEDHQINRRTEFKILSMGTSKNQPAAASPDTCTCKKQEVIIPVVPVISADELVVRGLVYREQNKAGLEAVIVLVTNNSDNSYQEVQTDKAGNYIVKLKPGMKYSITASKDACATFSKDFSTEGMGASGQIIENISFLCEGDIIKLEKIYYDPDKSDIRQDAALELDKLSEVFKTHPSLKMELRSHTDCRSSKESNMTLSDKRAKAASAYLVSKGVGEGQVTGKGYGESELVNDCGCEDDFVKKVCSEEEHRMNSRTEIKVLSVK